MTKLINMESIFRFIGSLVCHQLPERSLDIAGHSLAVCARCTGIYTGVVTSFVYLLAKGRLSRGSPVSITAGVFMALSLIPLIFDGVTSYLGFRQSSNLLRLVTGALFGYAIPVFITTIRNFNPSIEPGSSGSAIMNTWETVAAAGLSLAANLIFPVAGFYTKTGLGVLMILANTVICAGILILYIFAVLAVARAIIRLVRNE